MLALGISLAHTEHLSEMRTACTQVYIGAAKGDGEWSCTNFTTVIRSGLSLVLNQSRVSETSGRLLHTTSFTIFVSQEAQTHRRAHSQHSDEQMSSADHKDHTATDD